MADVTAAAFLQSYPEFASAYSSVPAMVDSALAAAMAMVSEYRWGAAYQRGVFLQAAHQLAMSPHGENTRLSSDKTSSPYKVVYDQMLRTLPGHILLGGGFALYPFSGPDY